MLQNTGYSTLNRLISYREEAVCGHKWKQSTWADVISSIPQCNVLGPILFVIYVNDLPDVLKGCVKMFADDIKVFTHIRDQKDSEILQKDLDSFRASGLTNGNSGLILTTAVSCTMEGRNQRP